MSNFKKSLRKIDISALPHIAGQLLQQLGEEASSDFKARREMPETEQHGRAERAELSFPDFEKSETQREFLQAVKAGERDFGFGAEAAMAAGREFATGELSEAAQRQFSDAAAYPRRVFQDMAQREISDSYAISPAKVRREKSDDHRRMEEISEFFRRDGRRYDGGFKQY